MPVLPPIARLIPPSDRLSGQDSVFKVQTTPIKGFFSALLGALGSGPGVVARVSPVAWP